MRAPFALILLPVLASMPTVAAAQPAEDWILVALARGIDLDGSSLPDDADLKQAAQDWDISHYEPLFPPEAGRRAPAAFHALALDRVFRARFEIPGGDAAQAAAAHAGLGGVLWAEVDQSHGEQALFPNDPKFGDQWALHNTGQWSSDGVTDADIDAPEGWEVAPWSIQLVVAVADSGINAAEPEISPRLWTNAWEVPGNATDDDGNGYVDDVDGWDFADGDNTPVDGTGHGTNVAGIIAAMPSNGAGFAGVCWHCSIMVVRDLNNAGSGWQSWAGQAVVYAVDNGADLVNMSTGGTGSDVTLERAVQYAHAAEVPVVAAMGNLGSSTKMYPAAYPETIAVGATTDADERASYSSFGSHVDVVAPGDEIVGLTNITADYTWYWSGTSQAAPHVTGLAALVLTVAPDLTAEQVRGYLTANAEDGVGDPVEDSAGWDAYYGHGRIRMVETLQDVLVDVTDADLDGFTILEGDCDDHDATRSPGEVEIADDGIDQDCSGSDAVTCHEDADGDGVGGATVRIEADGDCIEVGLAGTGGDCDDAEASVWPGADEVCDGLDNDCDTETDEGGVCDTGDTGDTGDEDGDCGCGGASRGSPWVLVLALVLARRRRPPSLRIEGARGGAPLLGPVRPPGGSW